MILHIPLRTVSGMNAREHWRKRAKRVEAERYAVRCAIVRQFGPKLVDTPKPPLVVKLTRIGPTNGLDPFDNLPSALKGCVDELSNWLGVDDRKSDLVRYECAQERGKEWGVLVEIRPALEQDSTKLAAAAMARAIEDDVLKKFIAKARELAK